MRRHFLALHGVLSALERSAELARQSNVQAPLVALALMTLLAVGALHHYLHRFRH